jgi:hypothetical protein
VGDGIRAHTARSAAPSTGRFGEGRPDIIDAEFIEVDHDTPRSDSARPPSGWTRH